MRKKIYTTLEYRVYRHFLRVEVVADVYVCIAVTQNTLCSYGLVSFMSKARMHKSEFHCAFV